MGHTSSRDSLSCLDTPPDVSLDGVPGIKPASDLTMSIAFHCHPEDRAGPPRRLTCGELKPAALWCYAGS